MLTLVLLLGMPPSNSGLLKSPSPPPWFWCNLFSHKVFGFLASLQLSNSLAWKNISQDMKSLFLTNSGKGRPLGNEIFRQCNSYCYPKHGNKFDRSDSAQTVLLLLAAQTGPQNWISYKQQQAMGLLRKGLLEDAACNIHLIFLSLEAMRPW